MTEQTLSDKRLTQMDSKWKTEFRYSEEDVKDFIKKLKEEIEFRKQFDGEVQIITLRQLEVIIDNLVGDKLC